MWKEVKEREENNGIHNAKLIMAINRISETLEESNNIFERMEQNLDNIYEGITELSNDIKDMKIILSDEEPEE